METYRDSLKVMTAYFERESEQYFFTPDGDGVLWYDTLKELREDTGIEGPVVFITKLSDF